MDGLTILNSYEKLTNGNLIVGLWILSIWFFIALVILAIMWGISSKAMRKEIVAFGVFAIIVVFCYFHIPAKKYETRYEVIVNDSVTMNEFQEKYEIIEVKGKIYTVRECVE